MAQQQHYVLIAETGYFGYSMGKGHFATDNKLMPKVSATCSCGVYDLTKPHSPTCSFGKALPEAKHGRL